MRKYMLYKHFNKSILTKNYANVAGLNNLENNKLFWSLWASDVGIGLVKFYFGVFDNKIINIVHYLVRVAAWGEIFLGIYDLARKSSSTKKLNELCDYLNEKGIYFDITGEEEHIDVDQIEDLNNNVIVTIKGPDDKRIVSENDDVITYYDADRQIDITDGVKKCLLSKRQYKKYINSKQNK